MQIINLTSMKNYKLTIKLESYTVIGAAGGYGTIIDTEVVFDPYGIPYIPGKRIKGLLRDSAMEIAAMYACETDNMKGLTDNTVKEIFGARGSNLFSNFYLDTDFRITGYDELLSDLKNNPLPVHMVKKFFSETIFQTAIDEDTGSATETSLRSLRVLKYKLSNGIIQSFQGYLRFPESSFEIMKLICSNLRRIGSKRNRGLGHVLCEIEEVTEMNNINRCENIDSIVNISDINAKPIETGPMGVTHYFELYLNNLQKILIRDNNSDENMVSSLDYIQGSNIMGLVAQKYFKEEDDKDKFAKLFLKGAVQFTNAYPCTNMNAVKKIVPFPHLFCINDDNIVEVGKKNKNEDGFIVFNNDNKWVRLKTDMLMNLYHERNPKTGMVDTTLYNYQAIAPFQRFCATIKGDINNLERIRNFFKQGEIIKIGASQTAEYGSCSLEIGEVKELSPDICENKDSNSEVYIMSLISDCIVYNKNGYPSTNIKDIANYFEIAKNTNELKIEPSKIRIRRIENYIKVWKSKKTADVAIKAGSCYELDKLPDNWEEIVKKGLGERCHEGFGQVMFLTKGQNFESLEHEFSKLETEVHSRMYVELKQYISIENFKNQLSLVAIEDADKFRNPDMGNFARQLLQLFKMKDNLNEVIRELSPVAQKKLEKYDNESGTSLMKYFRLEDKQYEKINKIFTLSFNGMLKKHFYINFLTFLHLSNKSS